MRRRKFLYLTGIQLASTVAATTLPSAAARTERPDRKVILVGFGGGTRYTESFGPQGQINIPVLRDELFPLGTFYSRVYNDGETTHYPATAAVLTGRWQNIAQYGGERPPDPTLFEYFRRQLGRPADDAWLVAQGKGFLTLGHSLHKSHGTAYGGHVVAPRQMLLGTFRALLKEDEEAVLRDRGRLVKQLKHTLRETHFESEVADRGFETLPVGPAQAPALPQSTNPDLAQNPSSNRGFGAETERFLAETVARFLAESDNPRSGDALNCFVAREIMTKFSPSLLAVNLGEIDIAHQGSFSLYLKAIRNADRQIVELWRHVQRLASYRDKTVFIVVPDHGRNLDGLGMNGFQHHRGGDDG